MKMLITLVLMVFQTTIMAQQAEAPAVTVVTDVVKQTEVVATTPVTGHIYSQNALQLTAAITGQLVFVAEPGTNLAEGDLIAKMDTTSLDLQKSEQLALINRAKAQLKYLQSTLKRQQDLLSAKSISANALEQTQSQRDVAQSDLDVAQLRLAQINDQINKSTIKATFNGVVSDRLHREGETVPAGTVLAAVTDLENLEIRAQVPLRYAQFVNSGQQLDIYAYGINQKAKVKSLIPNNNSRNQSYELRLVFSNENALTIGQLVSVSIPMYQARQSLVVNQDALVLRENGAFVFKVGQDNTVEQIKVETQENVGDLIAIKAELQAGDKIVIRGADGLAPGTKVTNAET